MRKLLGGYLASVSLRYATADYKIVCIWVTLDIIVSILKQDKSADKSIGVSSTRSRLSLNP